MTHRARLLPVLAGVLALSACAGGDPFGPVGGPAGYAEPFYAGPPAYAYAEPRYVAPPAYYAAPPQSYYAPPPRAYYAQPRGYYAPPRGYQGPPRGYQAPPRGYRYGERPQQPPRQEWSGRDGRPEYRPPPARQEGGPLGEVARGMARERLRDITGQ